MKTVTFSLALAALSVLVAADNGHSDTRRSRLPATKRCTGTIASLDDVAAAQRCATINIEPFTVPAGKTFELDLVDNAVVNVRESRQSLLSLPNADSRFLRSR